MNRERLERAATLLEGLPPEKAAAFDIDTWVSQKAAAQGSVVMIECGSTACAIGYCGLDPWFQEQGLWLVSEDIPDSKGKFFVQPRYHGRSGFDAIEDFFNISRELAECLFHPDGYYDDMDDSAGKPSSADVAKKIRRLLAEGCAYHATHDRIY